MKINTQKSPPSTTIDDDTRLKTPDPTAIKYGEFNDVRTRYETIARKLGIDPVPPLLLNTAIRYQSVAQGDYNFSAFCYPERPIYYDKNGEELSGLARREAEKEAAQSGLLGHFNETGNEPYDYKEFAYVEINQSYFHANLDDVVIDAVLAHELGHVLQKQLLRCANYDDAKKTFSHISDLKSMSEAYLVFESQQKNAIQGSPNDLSNTFTPGDIWGDFIGQYHEEFAEEIAIHVVGIESVTRMRRFLHGSDAQKLMGNSSTAITDPFTSHGNLSHLDMEQFLKYQLTPK